MYFTLPRLKSIAVFFQEGAWRSSSVHSYTLWLRCHALSPFRSILDALPCHSGMVLPDQWIWRLTVWQSSLLIKSLSMLFRSRLPYPSLNASPLSLIEWKFYVTYGAYGNVCMDSFRYSQGALRVDGLSIGRHNTLKFPFPSSRNGPLFSFDCFCSIWSLSVFAISDHRSGVALRRWPHLLDCISRTWNTILINVWQ